MYPTVPGLSIVTWWPSGRGVAVYGPDLYGWHSRQTVRAHPKRDRASAVNSSRSVIIVQLGSAGGWPWSAPRRGRVSRLAGPPRSGLGRPRRPRRTRGPAPGRRALPALGDRSSRPAGRCPRRRRSPRSARRGAGGPRPRHGPARAVAGRVAATGSATAPGRSRQAGRGCSQGSPRGGAVVDGQRVNGDPGAECIGPAAYRRNRSGLREVPDHGHRPARTAAQHGAPIHLGEFLRLVDDDVPVHLAGRTIDQLARHRGRVGRAESPAGV